MRRWPVLLAPGALGLLGCPNKGDPGTFGSPTEPSTSVAAQPPKVTTSGDPLASPAEGARIVALAPAEPLPPDALSDQGELAGAEVAFEVRPLALAPVPTALGAVPTVVATAQAAGRGSLQVDLGVGRVRLRVGARTFALDDGDELVADRRRTGFLLHRGTSYRVVPPGALRALLAERRLDVAPLAPSRLLQGADLSVLGRPAVRHTVTTAYGVLQLDQLVLAPRPPSAPKDAGNPEAAVPPATSSTAPVLASGSAPPVASALPPAPLEPGIDGAGEALCRAFLELVAAEQTLGGPPCHPERVPIRVEIVFARGGGLAFDATSFREAPLPRAHFGFPRRGSKLVLEPLAEPLGWPLPDLLALRPKGDAATLELTTAPGLPRVAMIDGLGVFVHGTRTVSLRQGHYQIEWRTPLFEVVEPAVEIGVPGKAHASIGPWPLGSAAPIASVRTGP